MVVLIALIATGLLSAIGYLLWRVIVSNRIRGTRTRKVTGAAFAAILLLAPWLDEYWGAREFERLCRDMPPTKFLGPVAVGSGPFFQENGSPTWADDTELAALIRPRWNALFRSREEFHRLRSLPVPIFERRTIFYYAPTGAPVKVLTERLSPGGWLRRLTGWGSHAPYQCPWKSNEDHSYRDYIAFRK